MVYWKNSAVFSIYIYTYLKLLKIKITTEEMDPLQIVIKYRKFIYLPYDGILFSHLTAIYYHA